MAGDIGAGRAGLGLLLTLLTLPLSAEPALLARELPASEAQVSALLPGWVACRAVDGRGRPLPFARFRTVAGGRESYSGSALGDGSFFLPPAAFGGGDWTRLELSAAGSSRILELGREGPPLREISLPEAQAPARPLPCDLVFVVDATASMASYLRPLERSIGAALAAADADDRLEVRSSLLLFRDAGDESPPSLTGLSADPSPLLGGLKAAKALGGGDGPEPVCSAIGEACRRTAWAAGSLRLVFAFTDAPPKDGGGEDVPEAAAAAAREAGARLFLVSLGSPDAAAEAVYQSLAAAAGGECLAADFSASALPEGAVGAVTGDLGQVLGRIIEAEADAALSGSLGRPQDPALELLEQVQERMAAALSYPEAARLRSTEGTALLKLRVDGKGRLAGASLASSSGSALLDGAALSLARSVFPLENPAGRETELLIAVRYRLEP